MTKGVSIHYGNFAPEAKENFALGSGEEAWFVDLAQMQQYNLDVPNYANPCESYNTLLDGSAEPFPTQYDLTYESYNLGFISDRVSLISPSNFYPTLSLVFSASGQYTSDGITLTFDKYNNIYPRTVTITWFRDATQLMQKTFTVTSAVMFCQEQVKNYNKVKIDIGEMNLPSSRLRLFSIDYGFGTVFYGDELRSVKLIQEINPISSEIAINTTDFTLDSKSDIVYSFQAKQPLTTYFNDKLLATSFVKTAKRQAQRLWQIQSEDYIGILDTVIFAGGMYYNQNAESLITEIFNVAKVPFSIDEAFKNSTVTGYLPYSTCRNALMQVLFAIGAVADTSNSDVVKVYKLSDQVKQHIPLNRIMQGQNFVDEETVTGIEVTSHTYRKSVETLEAYKAEDSGTGNNILVKFSEPLYNLTIVNGKIITAHTNYAIINANSNCVLTGSKYEHTTVIKTKNNPVVLASEIEKIIAVADATLVSATNIDNVLRLCYNWLIKTNTTNLKIVEGRTSIIGSKAIYGEAIYGEAIYGNADYGNATEKVVYDKPVDVGDMITCETEYLGDVTGRVIKETFNLNGNIIIKETVLK